MFFSPHQQIELEGAENPINDAARPKQLAISGAAGISKVFYWKT